MEKTNKITLDNMKDYKFYSFGNPSNERPLIEREIKNVTGIDLSNGFDLILIGLSDKEFIPLLDPFHDDLSIPRNVDKLMNYIVKDVLSKMKKFRGNMYSVHDSTGMLVERIDWSDFTEEELEEMNREVKEEMTQEIAKMVNDFSLSQTQLIHRMITTLYHDGF